MKSFLLAIAAAGFAAADAPYPGQYQQQRSQPQPPPQQAPPYGGGQYDRPGPPLPPVVCGTQGQPVNQVTCINDEFMKANRTVMSEVANLTAIYMPNSYKLQLHACGGNPVMLAYPACYMIAQVPAELDSVIIIKNRSLFDVVASYMLIGQAMKRILGLCPFVNGRTGGSYLYAQGDMIIEVVIQRYTPNVNFTMPTCLLASDTYSNRTYVEKMQPNTWIADNNTLSYQMAQEMAAEMSKQPAGGATAGGAPGGAPGQSSALSPSLN